jgi:hypothetical protein
MSQAKALQAIRRQGGTHCPSFVLIHASTASAVRGAPSTSTPVPLAKKSVGCPKRSVG